MKHRIRLITTLLLLAALMSSLVGCSPEDTQAAPGDTRPGAESRSPLAGAEGAVEELTAGTTGPAAETERMDRASADAYNNYAFRLFRETLSRENGTMMVSPYSLWFALGLLVNGANGETRTEIENMLGISTEQMNRIAAGLLKQEDEAEEKVFSTAGEFCSGGQGDVSPHMRNLLPGVGIPRGFRESEDRGCSEPLDQRQDKGHDSEDERQTGRGPCHGSRQCRRI